MANKRVSKQGGVAPMKEKLENCIKWAGGASRSQSSQDSECCMVFLLILGKVSKGNSANEPIVFELMLDDSLMSHRDWKGVRLDADPPIRHTGICPGEKMMVPQRT